MAGSNAAPAADAIVSSDDRQRTNAANPVALDLLVDDAWSSHPGGVLL